MNTEYYKLTNVLPSDYDAAIERAAEIIKSGGLVAFPTETVYGLGANGLNADACRAIYAAKGRPSDNPLILHVADFAGLQQIVSYLPSFAGALCQNFMPGPLTLVLPKAENVPDEVTGGLSSVAVRMPDNNIARDLIRKCGLPIAAPSANKSGRPSPTNAADVKADLDGEIAAVLDGGQTTVGLESTIIDCTREDKITILRPGAITASMLKKAVESFGLEIINSSSESQKIFQDAPPAPGMKYIHYAPLVPLTLVENQDILTSEYEKRTASGETVGVILFTEDYASFPAKHKVCLGKKDDLNTIAANLFHALRHFDTLPVDSLLCPVVQESGIGIAVMNRLRKASSGSIATN